MKETRTRAGRSIAKKRADQYDDPDYNYQEYWLHRQYEHASEETAIKRLLGHKHFTHAVDIGGGYGRLCPLISRYAKTVTLAEPSQQQLNFAEDFLKEYPQVERKLMQADHLEYKDNQIDLITMIRVMHHLPDPTAELSEIARVLKPGGYAIIEMANYAHGRNRLKYFVKGKKLPVKPVDIRSEANRNDNEIPFVNHNPETVRRQLKDAGLEIERTLSVSNLRSPGLKKLLPMSAMLAAEKVMQPMLAASYFGPSVFFLVKKA